MLLIGLTGSIATGKSTVSSLLSRPPHHLPVIDADLLARKVVEPGTWGYRRILKEFRGNSNNNGDGESILLQLDDINDSSRKPKQQPRLDRAALGRMVFGDSEEKKRRRAILNSIIHPAVRWEIYKALLYHYLTGRWAVVLDVPLLFESRLDLICGTVVVVAMADVQGQVDRLMERDARDGGRGLSVEEAWERVRSQWDVREKAVRCEMRNQIQNQDQNPDRAEQTRGIVIWNDGDRDQLKDKTDEMVSRIRRSSPAWWGWACLLLPPVCFVVAMWHVGWNLWDQWLWQRRQKGKEARKQN